MSEVIDLKQRAEETERMIWKCDCGNCSFFLYADGEIGCVDCEATQSDTGHYQAIKRWTRKVDEPLEEKDK